MQNNSIVVRNVTALIEERGLKKKAVATKAGLTPSQLANMLHGRKLIRADHIFDLAVALMVEPGELLKGRTAK